MDKTKLKLIQETSGLNELADLIHQNARDKGFHDDQLSRERFMERHLLLTVCEAAEAAEAIREGKMDKRCDKADKMFEMGLPPLTCIEEELADILIRTLDQCRRLGLDPLLMVRAKHAYNTTRPHLHGKKF